jgi:hypothetical protein
VGGCPWRTQHGTRGSSAGAVDHSDRGTWSKLFSWNELFHEYKKIAREIGLQKKGALFLAGPKTVSRSTYRVKQGKGLRRQRPGPFLGARGGWVLTYAPGHGNHGSRRADHGHRPPGPGRADQSTWIAGHAPGNAHQAARLAGTWSSGSRPPGTRRAGSFGPKQCPHQVAAGLSNNR